MVRTSVLHDALKNINNAEKAGKRQVMIRPSSKVIIKFLSVMQKHGMCGPTRLAHLSFARPFSPFFEGNTPRTPPTSTTSPLRHDNWTTVSILPNDPSLLSCR